MTIRARIDDGTAVRVDEKLADVMRVDPEGVGMDTKINILVDELEEAQRDRDIARNQFDTDSFTSGGNTF